MLFLSSKLLIWPQKGSFELRRSYFNSKALTWPNNYPSACLLELNMTHLSSEGSFKLRRAYLRSEGLKRPNNASLERSFEFRMVYLSLKEFSSEKLTRHNTNSSELKCAYYWAQRDSFESRRMKWAGKLHLSSEGLTWPNHDSSEVRSAYLSSQGLSWAQKDSPNQQT